ncbi:hypothetical protein AB0F42_04070 [Streptomyces buecherae]|uniref:hypothetical protein n=1 Tax=Streptomyces buecherae TaxID=2763006 RepID=UPI003400C571
MTWRSDVAGLLAAAGVLDVDVADAVADEHVRSVAYQRVVSVAAAAPGRERDRALVATILRDPHEMTAKTAVVALVDGVAMRASGAAEFRRWAAGVLPEVDRLRTEAYREFIRRRVHDWLFHLSVRDGHVPTAAELAQVTDWMQRLVAEESTSPAVLALLAESGHRRKTRNVAMNRSRSVDGSRGRRGAAGVSDAVEGGRR